MHDNSGSGPKNNDDAVLKEMDEQNSGEASALGSASAEVMDIDEAAESMGIKADENGPHELGTGGVIAEVSDEEE